MYNILGTVVVLLMEILGRVGDGGYSIGEAQKSLLALQSFYTLLQYMVPVVRNRHISLRVQIVIHRFSANRLQVRQQTSALNGAKLLAITVSSDGEKKYFFH